MVDNVGITVGIATLSLAVQKLFQLPVSLTAILNFGSLPLSTNVDQSRITSGGVLGVKSKSAMVENLGQPLESLLNFNPTVLKVISSSGFVAILYSQSTTSGDIYFIIFRHTTVESVGVAVGSMSLCRWN